MRQSPSQLTLTLDARLVHAGMNSRIRLTRVFLRIRLGHTISCSLIQSADLRSMLVMTCEMELCDIPSLTGNPSIVSHVHCPSLVCVERGEDCPPGRFGIHVDSNPRLFACGM